MPVPIDNDWIKGLLELGECLNTTALHHDIDILDIRVEPEFGYIHVRGTKVDPSGTKMREIVPRYPVARPRNRHQNSPTGNRHSHGGK